jgi:hypothetical protein
MLVVGRVVEVAPSRCPGEAAREPNDHGVQVATETNNRGSLKWRPHRPQRAVVHGQRAVVDGQLAVVHGQTAVVDGQRADVPDKRLLSTDKRLLSTDKRLMSTDKRLLSTDKRLLSMAKLLMSTEKWRFWWLAHGAERNVEAGLGRRLCVSLGDPPRLRSTPNRTDNPRE